MSLKDIYFAGGCFWGTEHYISQFDGVVQTSVGYANGYVQNPTYEQVYTDQTGYAECVKVTFDDDILTLSTICRLFFRSIDPLLVNCQGEDIGTRYRTGVYWIEETDKDVVDKIYDELQERYSSPLAVERMQLESFYRAEDYHQDYLNKNPDGYCHISLDTMRFAKEYSHIVTSLREISDPERREVLQRFFKTDKGEYAEGDRFLGVMVPDTRKVAKKFQNATYEVLDALIENEWHECRLCALFILIEKYRKSPEQAVRFYLKHTKGINNWDLVDLSAPYILGDYLKVQEKRDILYELAHSDDIWEQRIAIVSTLTLIREGSFSDTMRLAEFFLNTKHDLIQKSTGWMLREVGKRNKSLLIEFLDKNIRLMPRTMLRYAIEKFPPEQRKLFMRR